MSQPLIRKSFIFIGALLSGAAAAFLTRGMETPGSFPLLSELAAVAAALLAGALGLFLEQRSAAPADTPTAKNASTSQEQAELEQLHQELESLAQVQSSELARLNVELELEIAQHKQAEDQARLSEERFQNMADRIQEGLTIIENNRLVYVNQRACEIFGGCPQGNLHQRIREYAMPYEVERLEDEIASTEASGEDMQFELQYWILRGDGGVRCIHEHCATSHNQAVQRIFVVTSDITASVQAYQMLEQAVGDRTRELSTVLEVSKKIASTLELEPLLNLILDQVQAIIPYSGAAIFILEEQELRLAACQLPGRLPPYQAVVLPLAEAGVFRPVITNGQVMIIEDVHGASPLARACQESRLELKTACFAHARSWIGIPLSYHQRVTGMLSLTHSQSGYYTEQHVRLAQTITNQVAVAIENARLYEQAQNLATLQERHRIARELHDSATQLLYGINLYCTAASRSLRSQNFEQVAQDLTEIKDNALQALQEMRLLILELDPPLLQKEGLVAALQASLESIESRTGLAAELQADGLGRLPRDIETDLYRIAMEALNNLVRYARARTVTVRLQSKSGWVFLEIGDNGVGFDLEKARSSGGMGLHSMEQRARQLGGRLEICSQAGAGTLIRAEVPAQEMEMIYDPSHSRPGR
jgi:PAS domain S-box-containing protein